MNLQEKIKRLMTLLGSWAIIAILYSASMQPKSLAGLMKLFAMFTLFWTIFAAIFSVIAFFKWLFWAVFANI